jgi:ABC-type amino acid transport substrate-binding protein
VLTAGGADGVCYIGRGWIDGDFHWSPPVFEQDAVLAARADVPMPANLQALAGQPIGTVYAYRYPQVEQALGRDFVRDDAPSMLINLRKLAARRTRYAMTEQITLDFHIKSHPQDGLKVALQTGRIPTYCVFTLAHELPLERLDQAVRELVHEGGVEKILARYR